MAENSAFVFLKITGNARNGIHSGVNSLMEAGRSRPMQLLQLNTASSPAGLIRYTVNLITRRKNSEPAHLPMVKSAISGNITEADFQRMLERY